MSLIDSLIFEWASLQRRREWLFEEMMRWEVLQSMGDDLNMRANVCAMAGEIQKLYLKKNGIQFFLACGPDGNAWVRCWIDAGYKDVTEKFLNGFQVGDYIQVTGSLSLTDVWVERIKNDPPNRQIEKSEVPWQ